MRKFISSITASLTLTALLVNHSQFFPTIQTANAETFRTSYTIFGDLNDDKSIDSFDVILMRSKVTEAK